MKLGSRLRELRKAKGYTLRELAARVDVGFTYLCKIETDKLDRGHTPSDALLHKLADELDGDEDELLILSDRVPRKIHQRIVKRHKDFLELAGLDDDELSLVMEIVRDSNFTAS